MADHREGVDVSIVFNMHKIKYMTMDEIFQVNEIDFRQKTVNLYINLDMIFRSIEKYNLDKYIQVNDEKRVPEMIVNILNLAAHYRAYFTKMGIYSKVFLYLGYPPRSDYYNKEFISEYRSHYFIRYTNQSNNSAIYNTVEETIPLVKLILEYIKGVYLITSDRIEPSMTPRIIYEHGHSDNQINMIISTDKYDYQYVNNDFMILRPKALRSYLVTKKNAIQIMKEEAKAKHDLLVGPNFIPFILSMIGDPVRDIPKFKKVGVASLVSMIRKSINDNKISEDTSSIWLLESMVNGDETIRLKNNFLCTDLVSQLLRLGIRERDIVTSQIIDRFDNVSIRKVTEGIEYDEPINVVGLTSAINLIRGKKKSVFGI